MVSDTMEERIEEFILEGIDISTRDITPGIDRFWKALRETGTELWLDTGDIEAAEELWTEEMSALTTNNTLLNREIQKGIYDDFIKEADEIVKDLELRERVIEIAFILNARHGLRLVEKFGGKVSVELHTDLAHDLGGIVRYGKRFHSICPDQFIIKVPLTATGFIGARALRENAVPVNFTLGFSARQNYIAASFAKPNYGNVFLGRLNSYIADNGLGSGKNAGEKVTIASHRQLLGLRKEKGVPTKQIAASLRAGEQVNALAGVDVFTMPPKVAKEAKERLNPEEFRTHINDELTVELAKGIDPEEVKLEKTFEVGYETEQFAQSLEEDPPLDGEGVVGRAHELGCGDLFPKLEESERKQIALDGKIPKHERWKEKIKKDEIAVDTLLNLAGLASFTADQSALDERIEKLIG